MSSELPLGWEVKTLEEVAKVVGGGTPSTKEPAYFDGDVPWLTPKDLSGYSDRHVARGERNISEEGLAASAAQLLPVGTVLVSSRAPIGYVALAASELTTNQGFKSLVLGTDQLPEFYYYLLRASTARLESEANGSTFTEISGAGMKRVRVPVPPLAEQRAIASVLGALDDKIESNRRLSELLLEECSVRFRLAFPQLGRDPRVCSDPLPVDWTTGSLGELVDVVMGQSPPGESYSENPAGGPRLVQGMGGLGERYPNSPLFTSEPKKVVGPGTLLMTVRAPVGELNVSLEETCLGRGVCGIAADCPGFAEFLMRALKSRWHGEEGGTVFPAVNRSQIVGLQVVVPPADEIDRFEAFARPLREAVTGLHAETERLANARDAILPKLVSGQLRVQNVEEAVAA